MSINVQLCDHLRLKPVLCFSALRHVLKSLVTIGFKSHGVWHGKVRIKFYATENYPVICDICVAMTSIRSFSKLSMS